MGNLSKEWGFCGVDSKLELYGRKAEGQLEQSDNSSTARLPGGHSRHETKNEKFSTAKTFSNSHQTPRP